MDYCNYETIMKAKDSCVFVTKFCSGELINFTKMHYCDFSEKIVLTLIVFLIISIFCFRLISTTSSEYLSTSLTIISETLNFSQNLAGITFLAMGNGAPDIISSIVASGIKTKDRNMDFSLSALLGGSVLITTLVFSLVVYYGNKVKVRKLLFLRDIIFFIISIVILLCFSYVGQVKLWHSIAYLSIYVFFVATAIYQEYLIKQNHLINDEIVEKKETGSNIIGVISAYVELVNNKLDHVDEEEPLLRMNSWYSLNSKKDSSTNVSDIEVKGFNSGMLKDDYYTNDYSVNNEVIENNKQELYEEIRKQKKIRKYSKFIDILKLKIKSHYLSTQEHIFFKMNIMEKILYILIDFPFNVLRNLTIPACEQKKYHKLIFMLNPIFAIFFILLVTGNLSIFLTNQTYGLLLFVVIISILVLINFASPPDELPPYTITICLVSFIMCIFWIWLLATILMDVLDSIGKIFDIPSVFLGMTILTFGNSLPALANNGFAEMGIAGSIAGPLFNLLTGSGIVMLKTNLESGPITMNLFDGKKSGIIIILSMFVLLTNLILLLIQGYLQKFNFKKKWSPIGIFFYLSFIVIICVITFIY